MYIPSHVSVKTDNTRRWSLVIVVVVAAAAPFVAAIVPIC